MAPLDLNLNHPNNVNMDALKKPATFMLDQSMLGQSMKSNNTECDDDDDDDEFMFYDNDNSNNNNNNNNDSDDSDDSDDDDDDDCSSSNSTIMSDISSDDEAAFTAAEELLSSLPSSRDDEAAFTAAEELLSSLPSSRGQLQQMQSCSGFGFSGGTLGTLGSLMRTSTSDPSLLMRRQKTGELPVVAAPRRRLKQAAAGAARGNGNGNGRTTGSSLARAAPTARKGNVQGSVSLKDLSQMVQQNDAQMQQYAKQQASMPVSTSFATFEQLTSTQDASYGCNDKDTVTVTDNPNAIMKPDDYLAQLLADGKENSRLEWFVYDQLDGFFLPVHPTYIAAWTTELTQAVRNHDMVALQQLQQSGVSLQACNNFGESILHLCVRRGTLDMLKFLVAAADVNIRVCCDYGRTPLHDAAWSLTSNPSSYQMMELLLTECPMLLLIKDKRGFTPLSYVPRNHWAKCNAFLDRQYAKGHLSTLPVTVMTANNKP